MIGAVRDKAAGGKHKRGRTCKKCLQPGKHLSKQLTQLLIRKARHSRHHIVKRITISVTVSSRTHLNIYIYLFIFQNKQSKRIWKKLLKCSQTICFFQYLWNWIFVAGLSGLCDRHDSAMKHSSLVESKTGATHVTPGPLCHCLICMTRNKTPTVFQQHVRALHSGDMDVYTTLTRHVYRQRVFYFMTTVIGYSTPILLIGGQQKTITFSYVSFLITTVCKHSKSKK